MRTSTWKRLLQALFAFILVIGLLGFVPAPGQAATAVPTFSITAVEKDSLVTIKTSNFPANRTFVVRMGKYGTLGIGGTEVGTTLSGSGGTFTASYTIPDALKGQARIAIRLDATSGGFYSYNWFWNKAASTSSSTATAVPTTVATATSAPTYTGVPVFEFTAVDKGTSVTIKTHNFPANKTFTARMGTYGTLGIGGTVVGTTDSGSGGTFTVTYSIPSELKDEARLHLRLEAPGGYYSYNWFWNNPSSTSSGSSTTTTSYAGIPTIAIIAVEKDSLVTIKANNFPADRTFTVRMGKYGTLAIGGSEVGSTYSGTGGTFTATYSIPDGLKGQARLAIRLDSTTGGFYSYSWFWNTTTP